MSKLLLLVAGLCLLVGEVWGSERTTQDQVYRSPGGEFELTVSAAEANPFGAANYALSRAGETVWKARRAFTLQAAVVSDAGVVIGYALTRKNGVERGLGNVTVWRVGGNGEARVLGELRRRSPRAIHGSPIPYMLGVWLDPEQKLGIVHFENYELFTYERREHFWAFDLETGERVSNGWPAERSMEGTWSSGDGARPRVDLGGLPVVVPFVPQVLAETELFRALGDADAESPAAAGPVRDVVTFEPLDDGGFALVTRAGRSEPYRLVRVDAEGREVGPALELKLPRDTSKNIWAPLPGGGWVVATRGSGPASQAKLRWIDPGASEPELLATRELPTIEALVPLDREHLIALGARYEWSTRTEKLVLGSYTRAGEVLWETALEGLAADEPLARSALAVRTSRGPDASDEILVLRGHRRQIEVFSLTGKRLRTIDLPASDGKMRPANYPGDRTEAPHPLATLCVATDGELFVGGFAPAQRRLRLRAQSPRANSSLRQLVLEIPTGTNAEALACGLRAGPNNSLWSTDGNVIVRFDNEGVATNVFGTPRREGLPTDYLRASLDATGWIHISTTRVGSFFATDPSGAELLAYTLPPESTPPLYQRLRSSRTSAGLVLIDRQRYTPILDPFGSSWEFSSTGDLLGPVGHHLLLVTATRPPDSPIPQAAEQIEWPPTPAGGLTKNDLLVGIARDRSGNANTVTVLDGDLNVLARTNRRPSGDLYGDSFGGIDDLLTDAHGTIAVLEDGLVSFTTTDLLDGSTLRLPGTASKLLSLSKAWALIHWSGDGLLVHIESGTFYSIERPAELDGKRVLTTGLSPEGDELWYVVAEPLRLVRCTLPPNL